MVGSRRSENETHMGVWGSVCLGWFVGCSFCKKVSDSFPLNLHLACGAKFCMPGFVLGTGRPGVATLVDCSFLGVGASRFAFV